MTTTTMTVSVGAFVSGPAFSALRGDAEAHDCAYVFHGISARARTRPSFRPASVYSAEAAEALTLLALIATVRLSDCQSVTQSAVQSVGALSARHWTSSIFAARSLAGWPAPSLASNCPATQLQSGRPAALYFLSCRVLWRRSTPATMSTK